MVGQQRIGIDKYCSTVFVGGVEQHSVSLFFFCIERIALSGDHHAAERIACIRLDGSAQDGVGANRFKEISLRSTYREDIRGSVGAGYDMVDTCLQCIDIAVLISFYD